MARPDVKAIIRRLVADYTEHGSAAVEKMSEPEHHALLTEKRIHLQAVEGRCERGEGLHVNAVLKRILENQVKEIGHALERRNDRER